MCSNFVISILPLIIILKLNYFVNKSSLSVLLNTSFVFNYYFKNFLGVHILFFYNILQVF